MPPPTFDALAILQTLVRYKVDFIVVGGVCAALHGAPVHTFDLDLVHSRTPENVERLLRALEELDAFFREHGERLLRPTETHLVSSGHQLFMTRTGPLDLLGTIGNDRGYDDLLPHTVPLNVGQGLSTPPSRFGDADRRQGRNETRQGPSNPRRVTPHSG